MVRPEPIEPKRPEKNEEAKFALIKAMGAGITAISKEKEIFIESTTIEEEKHFELVIRVHVKNDKTTWDNYEDAKTAYNEDYSAWTKEKACEEYGITEEEREKAQNTYYEFRKAEDYKYPPSKSLNDFYREAGRVWDTEPQSPIIEVN